MIQCILGAKGGVGTSIVSQYLAYEESKDKKVLLVDGSFRERSQEVLNQVEDQGAFDFYDYLSNHSSIEDSIIPIKENFLDLLPASATHDLEEIEEGVFSEKCSKLVENYDRIIVDLSRWSVSSLKYWSKVAEEFLIVSTSEKLSLRGVDRIEFLCFREKIRTENKILINKISSEKEREEMKQWSQEIDRTIDYYIPLLELDEVNCPIMPKDSIVGFESPLENNAKKSWLHFLLGGRND